MKTVYECKTKERFKEEEQNIKKKRKQEKQETKAETQRDNAVESPL